MSAERLNSTTNAQQRFQVALATILRAVRRLGVAIKDLPQTSREWPGGAGR
jgi:hypothetical protein